MCVFISALLQYLGERVYRWRQTRLSLVMNAFCAGDEHLALEMNTIVLETNALKTLVRTSATHIQGATVDFHTELILR